MENPKPQEVKDVKKKELSEEDLKNVDGGGLVDTTNNAAKVEKEVYEKVNDYLRS
jgi:bacteriocin-like protein